MVEVITDERMRMFVHSLVSNEFSLTISQVAEQCKTYGRFASWLNSDVVLIEEVLTTVKGNGVSPAFFASYEKTEGYNSQWGWLNHTTQNGTYLNDSSTVSNWIVEQSNNTTDSPAWIDFANYNDFVPSEVKTAGNADFNNMPSGSIGKVVIAGTAAATWEVYYPNGLLASYNGVQDYGAPINAMIDSIEAWGGVISDGGTVPVDPTPTADFDKVISDVLVIVENGKNSLTSTSSVNTGGLVDSILLGLKDIYKPPLFMNSKDFYSNTLFKLTRTYKNMLKINPNTGLETLMSTIIEEAIKLIKVDVTDNTETVFATMVTQINAIQLPTGGTTTDPEPTTNKMFFPVDVTAQGINFWYPPDQPNMDYGGERSGRLHWAYDVGTLGNETVSCHAVRDGEVISIADDFGTVVIKHSSDTYYTQYMHLVLGSYTVAIGDKVVAGQKIGIVGGTGGYEIHLHFAVSKNGTFSTEADTIDPKGYLKITANNTTSLPNPII